MNCSIDGVDTFQFLEGWGKSTWGYQIFEGVSELFDIG